MSIIPFVVIASDWRERSNLEVCVRDKIASATPRNDKKMQNLKLYVVF